MKLSFNEIPKLVKKAWMKNIFILIFTLKLCGWGNFEDAGMFKAMHKFEASGE